jgi:hypothetical protein
MFPVFVRGEAYLAAHRVARLPASSRRSSIIADSSSTNPSVRLPILASVALMCCRATSPRPKRSIRISLRYGSTRTGIPPAQIPHKRSLAHAALISDGCLDVHVNKSGESILVEVWDNGHGIPDSLHDRIFEPFFTTRPPGKGLGLGLDAAQRIVKKHGGYIRIQRSDFYSRGLAD